MPLENLGDYPDEVRRTWSIDNSAAKAVRNDESMLEKDVSRYICEMPFLLTAAPKMFAYTRDDFAKNIQLEPIAFRAQLLST